MAEKMLLILERSSQNLQKITKNGKTILEGVFAEFGVENRNGRIYEEKEYLPHLEYLKKDIANNNLLGELDHPERFEVALGNVSHRISELWYDQNKRQILGRIEVLDTPKGQVAKSLLEAGIPLSISSRAAGTVNEDKTVSIQQIYTYDLVAKPGFENAQLKSVNESAQSQVVKKLVKRLNESYTKHEEQNLTSKLGILNENVSMLELADVYPSIREEAKEITSSKNKEKTIMTTPELLEDAHLQQWTVYFKNELSNLNERLDKIEKTSSAGLSEEIKITKEYVEKLREIQEKTLNWNTEIAKAVNKVGRYANTLAEKSNGHYDLTKKIVETVDYNAKTLNHTQDWIGENANVVNAIGNTVDHNAEMLNGINEWTGQIAKAVNHLNEWNEEIAPAVNGIHEWTSSIAKNLNHSVAWTEEMLGRAISKEEATTLLEYIDKVSDSQTDPELKTRINEMLKTNSITEKPLNEAKIKGIAVITADTLKKVGNVKVDTAHEKNTGVEFDKETKTITAKLRNIKLKKEGKPAGLNAGLEATDDAAPISKDDGIGNAPKDLKAGLQVTKTIGTADKKITGDGPKGKQNMKLDQKPAGKGFLTETSDIKERKANIDEKLEKIVKGLEKERVLDENVKTEFPFTQLLSESDRKRFAGLDATDKIKVATAIAKAPTTDSKLIVKIWESAVVEDVVEEPLGLTAAPKEYKDSFNAASDVVKESIKARAEFYELSTSYQINNFWETSGLVYKPTITLNESVIAKGTTDIDKADDYVAEIGEAMRKYSQF